MPLPRPVIRRSLPRPKTTDEDLHRLILDGVERNLRVSVIIHALITCLYQNSPDGKWEHESIRIFGPGNYFQVRAPLLAQYFDAKARGVLHTHRVNEADAEALTVNSLKLHYFVNIIEQTDKPISYETARGTKKEIDGKALPLCPLGLVIYDQGVPYAFTEDAPSMVRLRKTSVAGLGEIRGNPIAMGALVSTKMMLGIGDPNEVYDRPEVSIHVEDLFLTGPAVPADKVPKFIEGPLAGLCEAFENVYHEDPRRSKVAKQVLARCLPYLSGTRIPTRLSVPTPHAVLRKKRVRWED